MQRTGYSVQSQSNLSRLRASGFTIIELLVVIVVIAILAAITIVAYRGISQRAVIASLSSDLDNASKQLKLAQIDSGNYPVATDCSTPPAPNTICLKASTNTTYQYTVNNSTTPPTFCLTATNGSTSYFTTNDATPQAGGCPGHGTGGTAAITNLVTNPSAEGGSAGIIGTASANMTIATDWKSSGVSSVKMTPASAGNDSYFTLGGDIGGFRMGLQAGKTYTISATIHLSAPLTGTFNNNGSRLITGWYTNAAGNPIRVNGTQAPNSAGDYRVSLTYTIPSDATAAWLRFYHGGSSGSGSIWYDDMMVTEGSTLYNYVDPNTSPSSWVWNGTPNNSTSTGPAL